MKSLRSFALLWLILASAIPKTHSAEAAAPIQRIYLVHFSHTDFGFTDLQSVCRDLQVRYQLITGSKFLQVGQHADGVRFE